MSKTLHGFYSPDFLSRLPVRNITSCQFTSVFHANTFLLYFLKKREKKKQLTFTKTAKWSISMIYVVAFPKKCLWPVMFTFARVFRNLKWLTLNNSMAAWCIVQCQAIWHNVTSSKKYSAGNSLTKSKKITTPSGKSLFYSLKNV